MTLAYEDESGKDYPFPAEALAKEVTAYCLDYIQCPYETEISLLLTTDEKIKSINLKYREIEKTTDVLSFPAVEYQKPGDFTDIEEANIGCFNPETGELILGDIVISGDRAVSQAESYGHSLKREFAFLLVHSMLHLMGYDHIEEQDKEIMESKQAEILEQLEITR